ncbi:MAG TPA: ABC transporter permease [candidate division Zixibacteria bacterium]|jgi:sodium transport system permease protein
MTLSRISIIFQKELIDTLRDRRTLIFMLLVPIVAIPLLLIGLTSLMVSQLSGLEAETAEVVVVGKEYLPDGLLSKFAENTELTIRGVEVSRYDELLDSLRAGAFEALLNIPEGFAGKLEQEQSSSIAIHVDQAEVKSEVAVARIQDALSRYKDELVSDRLLQRGIPGGVLIPFEVNVTNVATPRKMAGREFGAFLPYLIIIMCFMGAMYPAIDLAAGEKERGTLETLLVSPATREEIVLGKYLVIVLAGLVTAFLSMGSLGISLGYVIDASVPGAENIMSVRIDPSAAIVSLLTMLPLAGFFAAVLISVSVFARSFKEAQSYVTALNMAVILPAFVSMLPGVDPNYLTALIPVVNASLILRDAVSGTTEWPYVGLALIANSVLAFLTLRFAMSWFRRESIVFRM